MRGNQRQSEAIRGNLYWSDFGRQFGMAALYVMPVYPLLVVSGSAVLFLSTSVLTVVGIGLEQVRWFVNLGSLHAPFICVHVRLHQTVSGTAADGMAWVKSEDAALGSTTLHHLHARELVAWRVPATGWQLSFGGSMGIVTRLHVSRVTKQHFSSTVSNSYLVVLEQAHSVKS